MRYTHLLLVLTSFILLSGKCKNRRDEIFCQGEVIEETLKNADNGQTTYRLYLVCASKCRNGSLCDSIVQDYDPPLDGWIVRRVWCGCKGDLLPQGCDVILQRGERMINDTTRLPAICTKGNNSCPVPGDTCLPQYKQLKDTIRSVVTQRDSIYRTRDITTCECRNRIR